MRARMTHLQDVVPYLPLIFRDDSSFELASASMSTPSTAGWQYKVQIDVQSATSETFGIISPLPRIVRNAGDLLG